ncbi:MAG: hypothetical protein TUN42_04525 [Dehalogenimonas sp.]
MAGRNARRGRIPCLPDGSWRHWPASLWSGSPWAFFPWKPTPVGSGSMFLYVKTGDVVMVIKIDPAT